MFVCTTKKGKKYARVYLNNNLLVSWLLAFNKLFHTLLWPNEQKMWKQKQQQKKNKRKAKKKSNKNLEWEQMKIRQRAYAVWFLDQYSGDSSYICSAWQRN